MQNDETKEFLDSLPELEEGKTYCFKCYPGIECFNACCSDLDMVLTPYDVLRMRAALDMPSVDFLRVHATGFHAPDTNFPVFKFKMLDNARRSCAFVTPEGCRIYADRPGACRMYPLGRATRPDGKGGVLEQFFIVREDHCKGFLEKDEWTGESWKQDQGFKDYTAFNDRYMNILSRTRQLGHPISDKLSQMAILAFYKIDEFQGFIEKMQLFERVDVDEKRQKAILTNENVALSFAMDWFELVLFQDTTKLKPKNVPCGAKASGPKENNMPLPDNPKLMSIRTFLKRKGAFAPGHRLVFTNGCFDILHPGHVDLLERARAPGDSLVLGLNSDESVKMLGKGDDRPLNTAEERAFVLAGLACVDHIIIFHESTPLELIKACRPQILIKGGDWPVDQIVGADVVTKAGGEVHSLPLLEGYSTTAFLEKVRG